MVAIKQIPARSAGLEYCPDASHHFISLGESRIWGKSSSSCKICQCHRLHILHSTAGIDRAVPGEPRATAMSHEKVFHEGVQEDAVLESLGYQQELKRSFGLIGMIGFSFSIVTSWSALGGVLIVGVESGGPPVMIYSWIGISVFALAVAYAMAEICSAYPVAGGQYSWVAVLAPPSVARGMSYVTGWFMITGTD